MAEISPAQLAQYFKLDSSTNTLTLKDGLDIGGVDTIPVGGSFTFTDLGAGPTNGGSAAPVVDLRDFTQMKFSQVCYDGVGIGSARLRYATIVGDYADLTVNTLPFSTDRTETAWEDIPAAARTIVTVQFHGIDGNGAEDPNGFWVVYFRR